MSNENTIEQFLENATPVYNLQRFINAQDDYGSYNRALVLVFDASASDYH